MPHHRLAFKQWLKNWMLIIAMVLGVGLYLLYRHIPALHPAGPVLESVCKGIQPVLLFAMLFLSFCNIEIRNLRPHKWQMWLLAVQCGLFTGIAATIFAALHTTGPVSEWILARRQLIEAGMICLICPTATACAVVTGKLGGNMAGVVSYTVLINIAVSVLVPAVVPLLYPDGNISFLTAFGQILGKVFPLLILPCVAAWAVRYFLPKTHAFLLRYSFIAFYIWAAALTLAILMSVRAIYHNEGSAWVLAGIAAVSLFCCVFQFWAGKRIGARYACRISAGQALGQKNTVFSIWLGYSFFDPITSVAGGFYSIWHNCYNSWQLYRHSPGKQG